MKRVFMILGIKIISKLKSVRLAQGRNLANIVI